MDTISKKEWFIYIVDRHVGPFSAAEVQQKLRSGEITSENYLWKEGMTDWTALSEIPDLASQSPTIDHEPEPIHFGTEPGELSSFSEAESGLNSSLSEPSLGTPSSPLTGNTLGQQEDGAHSSLLDDLGIEPEAEPKKSFLTGTRVLVLILVIAIAAVGGILYPKFTALKDGTPSTPVEASSPQNPLAKTSDLLKPYLVKISEKLPFLSRWVSPIAQLSDVTPEEYEQLKTAAKSSTDTGLEAALALSQSNTQFPHVYVSANVPDGTRFRMYIIGKSDTLLNQMSFGSQDQITISGKLGKSGTIQYSEGNSVPKGEYWIFIATSPSDDQPATASTVLALPSKAQGTSSEELPSELPKDIKIFAQKSYFLGGPKDETYNERLKAYHAKLQKKATDELADLKQFTSTLSSQLESSNTKFTTLKRGKITEEQKKAWLKFHTEWTKLQSQLDAAFANWTPENNQTEHFYSSLFEMVRQAGLDVNKVHGFYHVFFSGHQDLKSTELQTTTAVSETTNAITLLKSKIEKAATIEPTVNGMPRKEGL